MDEEDESSVCSSSDAEHDHHHHHPNNNLLPSQEMLMLGDYDDDELLTEDASTEINIRESQWWGDLRDLDRPLILGQAYAEEKKALEHLQVRLRKIETGIIVSASSFLLFHVMAEAVGTLNGDAGVIVRVVGVVINYALAAAFVVVGGRENVDWRIAGELARTWKVYVILFAVTLNVLIDFVSPYNSTASKVDTFMFLLPVLWFCFQDAFIYLTKRFRWISTFCITLTTVWNFSSNLLLGTTNDTRIWGIPSADVKVVLYSQIAIISWTAVKRVFLDAKRRYLHLPTMHCRRRPIQHRPVNRLEALSIGFMLSSAIITLVSWSSRSIPVELLYATELLALAFLASVYFRNVDVWVLQGLLRSYEVVVIITAATCSIIVNYKTEELSTYEAAATTIVDSASFACITVLFCASDALKVRSLFFRKFCYGIFMLFVVLNLVASQLLVPNEKIHIAPVGLVHSQYALFSCYLQIFTMATPALFCVMTDSDQQKIALVRCSMLRPPPPAADAAAVSGSTASAPFAFAAAAVSPSGGASLYF